MKKEEVKALSLLLKKPKRIAIIPHRSPDGDAMGSTLALYHFLKKLNHKPVVISPNDFPNFLSWLPGSNNVLIYENNKVETTAILEDVELVFTLDFNALHRTGEMEQVLNKLLVPFVMIDHHEKPSDYAQLTYSDTSIGSTSQMIYHTIEALGKLDVMDKEIATCIYTGIMTDSGSFRFPSTTSTTHRIVAHLIDIGINNSEIHNLVFDSNSYDRLQLLGKALQNMKINIDHKTAYTYLTQKDLDNFHYQKGDTEGFVNYGLTIKGINFAVIFIEHRDENIIKISFRSQGSFNVNEFARQYFNGGGHINASGGKSYESMSKTIQKFEAIMENTKVY
jgi:bifunctional oligoribonuclease and PAP phosphatase NrnA